MTLSNTHFILIGSPRIEPRFRIIMIHLRFRTVMLALLSMFRWHMKINMTQKPPIRKPLAIIQPPPSPPLARYHTIQSYKTILIQNPFFIQRLCHSQRMSFHRKGIAINHVLPGTARIFIFHPMQVNTCRLVGIICNSTISFEVNGRLMVTIARSTRRIIASKWTILTRVAIDIPTARQHLPVVSISQLYLEQQ
jgi:hypothetical protein